MKQIELNQTLKSQARSLGLCDEWYYQWDTTCTQQDLIDKYIKGLDFAIKHDYPSTQFIVENFDRGLLHKNHIYCDEDINIYGGGNGFYVINGDCAGAIHLHTCAAATIFVRHNSRLKIKATRLSRVIVKLYNNAEVETESDAGSTIKVFDKRR